MLPVDIGFFPNYPNRIYVVGKQGFIWLVLDGEEQPRPILDMIDKVNNTHDRGMLSATIHPDFPEQPYLYVLYTYDPPQVFNQTGEAGKEGVGQRVSRPKPL
ncbi:MAG: PQQ-dependent sugar dehydrogenase [Deinococcales bacterium]